MFLDNHWHVDTSMNFKILGPGSNLAQTWPEPSGPGPVRSRFRSSKWLDRTWRARFRSGKNSPDLAWTGPQTVYSILSGYFLCLVFILLSVNTVLQSEGHGVIRVFHIFNLLFHHQLLIIHTTKVDFCHLFIGDIIVVLIVVGGGIYRCIQNSGDISREGSCWPGRVLTVTINWVVTVDWVDFIFMV